MALLTAWLVGSGPAAAAGTAPAPAAPASKTGSDRVVRIGVEERYAPFLFVDKDGQPRGIAVDTLRLLERRAGVRFEVAARGDLATLLDMARRGELDVLPAITWTPERASFLGFTAPYFSVPAVSIVRRGWSGPAGLDGMTGRRVAVGRGYAVEEFLRKRHPGLTLVPAPNDEACLRMVVSGTADAAVVDLASASWIIDSTGLQGVEVLGDVGFSYELAIATRSGEPELRALLDRGLRQIPPSEARRIRDEWVRFEPPRSVARLAIHVAFALGTLALVAWVAVRGVNWALRRLVSERTHALAQSEARLRAMFEDAAVGIVEIDPGDRVVAVNARFCEMLGYSRSELLGKTVHEITEPEDRALTRELYAKGHSGGTRVYGYEKRYLRKDGTRLWARVNVSVVRDEAGQFVRAIGTAEDVTGRRRAQDALRESEAHLRLANERLREADRRKDEFLGMLSHELRNPLAPIRNSLYILDNAEPRGQQAHRAREIAKRQVAHMTRIVDDLLDVTRVARGKIELRKDDLDLAVVARRAADDHRPLMQNRGVELRVALPPAPVVVRGDETRLAQVLGNLLHNASKFTPAGGQVTLSLGGDGGRAVIHVRDTGVGMDEETLGSIFEPFVQAKQSLARSEGGLGLGLALVKGLVEMHGGEVTARSPGPGRGTDVMVTLPLDRRQAVRARPSQDVRAGADAASRRVLVVDDNVDAAESLADLLRMVGHEVTIAHDGPSALELVLEKQLDVVLCDIGLPGMDGYEVARRIRAAGARVRLVAVTGYAQPEDLLRATEAGFDSHVAKPPDPERLASLLH